jgi:hypothetical protein
MSRGREVGASRARAVWASMRRARLRMRLRPSLRGSMSSSSPSGAAQAGLQGDLEELLRCPVHVATTRELRYARESTREQIEREAMWL